MFGFEQENDTDTEMEMGFCVDLMGVADELDIDTSFVMGLDDMDVEQLQSVKQILEAAIEQGNQEKLRSMGRCCMGYKWHREGTGYRCAGGSHYVTDEQLKRGDNR